MNSSNLDNAIPEREEPGSLSWASFFVALFLLLGVFIFLNPIWEQNDMGAWNENIWYSYLPIPFLVMALLKLVRKLSWTAIGFETMKLTFVKFVLTYPIATALWEIRGVPGTGIPPMLATTDSSSSDYDVKAAPRPSLPDASELGQIAGVLHNAASEPLDGVLVYVQAGLADWTFEASDEPVVLANDGSGFGPTQSVVQAHQVVALRSDSGSLHTGVFSALDPNRTLKQRLLNYPVIPGGERQVMFDRELGWLELSCSVHSDSEPRTQVLVLAHSFWTRTDSEGRFLLADVPAGALRVEAWVSSQSNTSASVLVTPKDTTRIEMVLSDETGGA